MMIFTSKGHSFYKGKSFKTKKPNLYNRKTKCIMGFVLGSVDCLNIPSPPPLKSMSTACVTPNFTWSGMKECADNGSVKISAT